MSYFLGMRGTEDWGDNVRPKSWRDMILYLYPNGQAPLTAMLAKMSKEKTEDAEFNWWTQTLAAIGVDLTNVYTDVGLSSAYTGSGVNGDTLYIKLAEADAKKFRAGHEVLFRMKEDSTLDCVGKVTGRTLNGASSHLSVRLLEDDDNSSSNDISSADRLLLIGNINSEGAEMPESIALDPVKFYNLTQIWRTPLSITRTARKTKLRTGDAYQKAKREALEMHSIEMEMSMLFSIRTESTGTNGMPERTTMGLQAAIRSGAPANIDDYRLNADFAGDTWLASGEEWLDAYFEQLSRWGAGLDGMLAFCGSGALLGINKLAKASGQIQLQPTTTSYGLKVNTWTTPFGDIALKQHPLFNYEETLRHAIMLFKPTNLNQQIVDDTTFYADGEKQNTGHNRIDGTKEEYLTELGLEYHHPETMGMMYGVGKNNSLG